MADKRQHKRSKVAISGHVCDQLGGEFLRCLIRDASLSGCRLVCAELSGLSDMVSLKMPKMKEVMDGRIVWRRHNMAGVEFIWRSNTSDRRGRRRRDLNLTVAVHDLKDDRLLLQAIVTDASKDGCRLEADDIYRLPAAVRLKVPGLMEPAKAYVAWRERQAVGIEFHWKRSHHLIEA